MSQQYDGTCAALFQTGMNCTVTLTVPRAMNPPIYVYYELNNAYFNHRRMVLSRSDAQLRGDPAIADALLKTCAPQEFQGGNGAQRSRISIARRVSFWCCVLWRCIVWY